MQDVTLKKQVAGDFWLKLVVPLCGRRLTSEKSLLIVFVSCIVCFVGFSDCLVHVKHFFCVSALLLPHCAFEHMFSQCVTGFRLLPNTAVECLCVCAGGVNADTRAHVDPVLCSLGAEAQNRQSWATAAETGAGTGCSARFPSPSLDETLRGKRERHLVSAAVSPACLPHSLPRAWGLFCCLPQIRLKSDLANDLICRFYLGSG